MKITNTNRPIVNTNGVACGKTNPKSKFIIKAVAIGKLVAPNIFKLHLKLEIGIFLTFKEMINTTNETKDTKITKIKYGINNSIISNISKLGK